MPIVKIDNQPVEVPEGATVLDAARRLGIDIPNLCYVPGRPPRTSCMACLVRINGKYVPSCATKVRDGLEVESETNDVHAVRRTALELLLSDHAGDCLAPCECGCPADVNIPEILHLVEAGRHAEAAAVLDDRLPLAASIERFCPAPCENGCRRARIDSAAAIRLVNRSLADDHRGEMKLEPDTGRAVAVIGGGVAGLSAACFLRRKGHRVTVFDRRPKPGGALRDEDASVVPPNVIDADVARLEAIGVEIRSEIDVGKDLPVEEIVNEYDAVLLATGAVDESFEANIAAPLKLKLGKSGLTVNAKTHLTTTKRVYATGDLTRSLKNAARAVGGARSAATAIDSALDGIEFEASKQWSVHLGKLSESDLGQFQQGSSDAPRAEDAGNPLDEQGLTTEGSRCLHCDCRCTGSCKLKFYSESYGARARRFDAKRPEFAQDTSHPDVIYEPGKCIACGICIDVAQEFKERLGLTFIGRGFNVRIGAPQDLSHREGLTSAADQAVEQCPTGALAYKDEERNRQLRLKEEEQEQDEAATGAGSEGDIVEEST
jgi:ferredoxin